LCYRLTLLPSRQAKLAFRQPGGGTCRQAPSASDATMCRYRLAGRPSPPGITLFRASMIGYLPLGESTTTARRYTNTCALLVFKHPKQIATRNLSIKTCSDIY